MNGTAFLRSTASALAAVAFASLAQQPAAPGTPPGPLAPPGAEAAPAAPPPSWQQGRSNDQASSPLHPIAPILTGRPAAELAHDKLKVPPGSQDGRALRVRGKGAPKLKHSGRGDLIARVRVRVPESLSDEQRAALEQFAALDGSNPRTGLFG